MEKLQFIGIDISGQTLDICLQNGSKASYHTLKNTLSEISKFFHDYDDSSVIIGMENTGRYNYALYEALSQTKARVYVFTLKKV